MLAKISSISKNSLNTLQHSVRRVCKISAAEKLIGWFLNSPIYKNGAYKAYYSKRKIGPSYPEITAYAISLSCILYERKKQKLFLDRAEKCAEYMMNTNRNGGVPGLKNSLLYTFDTGIFISSMFDLYKVTENVIYLNEAEKSLEWLHSYWDGKRFAAVNKISKDGDWYHFPSVHLAKLAIPLIKASIYLKDEKYEKTAFNLLDYYKKLQLENGRFSINGNAGETMVHPHCYATEGFLYAYYYSKKGEFLEIVKKSIDWLSKTQNGDGSFFRWYPVLEKATKHGLINQTKSKRQPKVTDATAQATRLWKLLGVNKKGIEKAYEYLNSELEDNALKLYKNYSLFDKLFTQYNKVYSWPTFFYLHSLLLPYGKIECIEEIF